MHADAVAPLIMRRAAALNDPSPSPSLLLYSYFSSSTNIQHCTPTLQCCAVLYTVQYAVLVLLRNMKKMNSRAARRRAQHSTAQNRTAEHNSPSPSPSSRVPSPLGNIAHTIFRTEPNRISSHFALSFSLCSSRKSERNSALCFHYTADYSTV